MHIDLKKSPCHESQPGLFDYTKRLARIDKAGDPLPKLNETVDWELFRKLIEMSREKQRKSPAGAKGYDTILMFKILILQGLYNLSDDAIEYQIRTEDKQTYQELRVTYSIFSFYIDMLPDGILIFVFP